MQAAIAVVAHHRQEAGERAPAGEQFLEGIRIDHAVVEPSHIGGEPRDAGHAHMDRAGDLRAQIREGRPDVARPDERPVALGPGPRASGEVDDLPFGPGLQLPFVEPAVVGLRIHVADVEVAAEVVPVVAEIIDAVFGFGLVEPERAHALVPVVLAATIPHERAGARVGRVVVDAGLLEHHVEVEPGFCADQIVVALHFHEILGRGGHLRPDRHHELDAHRVEFGDHRLWIRPEFVLELVVAKVGPVEEIDDDEIERDLAALELARHIEQLLLVPVAQLALPEAHAPLGHRRRMPGRVGVLGLDLRIGAARGDPIVDLIGGLRRPLGTVAAERGAPDRRIVPQEPVALGGDDKRHGCLRVAVGQLEGAALEVQHILLVLAHAVQPFLGIGAETRGDGEALAGDRGVVPRFEQQRPALRMLAEQQFALGVPEAQITAEGLIPGAQQRGMGRFRLDDDLAVGQRGGTPVLADRDGNLAVRRSPARQQRPIDRLEGAVAGGAHAHAVRAPRLDAQRLAVAGPDQRITFDGEFYGHDSDPFPMY